MSCQETQQSLSLYVDDQLALPVRAACEEHLRECPMCRAELAEMRAISRGLATLQRPLPPPDMASAISDRLLTEAAAREADAASYKIIFVGTEGPSIYEPITPELFAAQRSPFNGESPSLNPRGALAELTRSRSHGHEEDGDDMIVVADVFSNGRASLADVVQAPRDRRMLDEFQVALRKNAAFVPAYYDRRPETMRVVFVVQKVDVPERNF